MEDYTEKRRLYLADPEEYIRNKAKELTWFSPWTKLHNYDTDPYDTKWFIGGSVNICYEVLDKHVLAGEGDFPALIYEDPMSITSTTMTYAQLLDQVSRMATVLTQCGVQQGDIVAIYMPAIPETVVAMLAAARIGAPYTVMGTFHPTNAMVDRIDDFKPKLIITTNYEYVPNDTAFNPKAYLDEILSVSRHKPERCIVLQRKHTAPARLHPNRDLDWHQALASSEPRGPEPLEINETIYVIYTSGSTGKPKGIVTSIRQLIFCLLLAEDIFIGGPDKEGNDSVALSTSLYIWVGGQIGGVYAPFHRALTTLVLEKSVGSMKAEEFYKIISKHQVSRMFVPTSTLRPLIRQDTQGEIVAKYQSQFKVKRLLLGAVPGDKATFDWLTTHFKAPFGQLYGLTEAGIMTTVDLSNGRQLKDQPQFCSGKVIPGADVRILNEDGTEADTNEIGRIVMKLPSPILMSGFLNAGKQKFINDYLKPYPGYFYHHDEGYFDDEGHLYILNRTDSVFKIHGSRMSCDALEEVLMSHPKVAECVVVTKEKTIGTEVPIGFFTLIEGAKIADEDLLPSELQRLIANKLGDWVVMDDLIQVPEIPKTVTGKIARGTIREIVRQEKSKDTEDPILKHFWDIAST